MLSEVKEMFDAYASPDKIDCYDEMWFSFNGIPLKWYKSSILYHLSLGTSQLEFSSIPWLDLEISSETSLGV